VSNTTTAAPPQTSTTTGEPRSGSLRRGAQGQAGQIRKKIKTHPDGGLHALGHAFLTESGQHTAPFTLQYVAGHDNIKAAMRYVPLREAVVHKLFGWLAELQRPEERVACNKSVQNPVQLEIPPGMNLLSY
jgi:hypothetical protein